MIVSSIVAVGKNNEIGKNNDLLWHLPKDMQWFIDNTRGHTVIMGRKTYESLGKPLPKRLNIIITRNKDFNPEGVIVTHTIEDALQKAKEENTDEAFIIGGGHIYEQTLDMLDRLYLTQVHGSFAGADTFFPEINWDNWRVLKKEENPVDERHAYAFDFYILERKKG